jgi:hypothetical protein
MTQDDDAPKPRTVTVSGNGQRIAGRHFISNMTISVGGGVRISGVGDHFGGVQGSGRLGREERNLPAFGQIMVASCVDVLVAFGPDQRVVVEGDDNLLALVDLQVEEPHGPLALLRVDVRESLSTQNPLVVHVTMPRQLLRVIIAGSGNVSAQELRQDTLELSIRGSGDIRVSGEVGDLIAGVYGSGDLKLRALNAKNAQLDVQGSGDITATVSHSVIAGVQGSGDITIVGNPPSRKTRVNGSGDIEFE